MQKSAVQLKIEAQLQASIDLLKRAKPYVGRATTIGGQDLSREITEFVASVDRNPALDAAREALQPENQRITPARDYDKLASDFEAFVQYMDEGCVCGRAPKPVNPVDPRLLTNKS